MRSFRTILAVITGAFALTALVGALRRESVGETPGSVVEKFLTHLASDRTEKARSMLSPELLASVPPAELERWEAEAAEGLGSLENVRGETEWISGDEAEATGVLETDRRERRLRFLLKRGEGGRWAIARLDRFWGDESAEADAPETFRVREGWRERARPVSTVR